MPIQPWGLLATPLQWGPPQAAHVPCPSRRTARPHNLLIQTLPQCTLCSLQPGLTAIPACPLFSQLPGPLFCFFVDPRGRNPSLWRSSLFPKGIIIYFPKGTSFTLQPSPNGSLYNVLQGFSKSSPRPPESRSWVWARNSQCIMCHF